MRKIYNFPNTFDFPAVLTSWEWGLELLGIRTPPESSEDAGRTILLPGVKIRFVVLVDDKLFKHNPNSLSVKQCLARNWLLQRPGESFLGKVRSSVGPRPSVCPGMLCSGASTPNHPSSQPNLTHSITHPYTYSFVELLRNNLSINYVGTVLFLSTRNADRSSLLVHTEL